jgi:hypothetical protein
MLNNADLIKKWGPVLEHADLAKIKDSHRRNVTAALLENTVNALREAQGRAPGSQNLFEGAIPQNAMGASSSNGSDGAIDTFDPVLISLVRRSMPNLIAYDLCGVQPMTGPTGLIFAMRSRYANQAGTEAFYNEVNTQFSSVTGSANTQGDKHAGSLPGNSSVNANLAQTGLYNYGGAMSRAQGEALGTTSNTAFPEMAFSIERVSVTANTRALKAEYTMELAQDLKAIHGLDAEAELSNILSTEILAEINREIVRTINITAKPGCQENTTAAGFFDLDTDSNGRWSVERFKGLMFQLEREANQIAKQTRRGKGNFLLCSSDVASALRMAGVLDIGPILNSMNQGIQVDDTGSTFAGVLNGTMKVYIDPYSSGGQYMTVGYKGASPFDAGLFYCPYVPLQMVRAVDQDSFQPKIGFKTRYGVVANPFAEGTTAGIGALTKDSNVYYRRSIILNLQ